LKKDGAILNIFRKNITWKVGSQKSWLLTLDKPCSSYR